MHLKCFPPTLSECALFRKRILLDHVLAKYGVVWFDVGQSGGRPHSTTQEAPGYDVGQSVGRPHGTS